MSMMEPFMPGHGEEQGTIPAADPGTGAPEPSEGFGVGGEEPDVTETDTDTAPGGAPGGELEGRMPKDVPFRTPEPGRAD